MQPMEDPVAEAIARRGVGQQAPMMPQAPVQPQGQAPEQPMQQSGGQASEKFMPKDGHELMLATLAEQLKNDHKLEMEKLKMSAPKMPFGGGGMLQNPYK